MTLLLFKKPTSLTSLVNSHFILMVSSLCTKASAIVDKTVATPTTASVDNRRKPSANYSSNIHLSPLFSHGRSCLERYDIELVDDDAWQISSGLAHAYKGLDGEMEAESQSATEVSNEQDHYAESLKGDSDFDEIDNMRIRGNLFYKLDRDSKEFEEYNFEFHRKKSSKRNDGLKGKEKKESSKKYDINKEIKKKEHPSCGSAFEVKNLPQIVKNERVYSVLIDNMDGSGSVGKNKVRTPTFNQLTAPYHEPFCLDIFISKASVRACIIHRVTSKVVAVAHSISKDIKFDLPSTRNAAACDAVGTILAQRALADDIHNVFYTPRKGEKLEGKLQIVLQSIIDNGINVKVKLKQRKPQKARLPPGA
ncbi:uncharacterized protein LOC110610786 [Manihot esculenta]|uniref:Uncharacterized protein n=1 Tax=Manihot esculenta TaxID=3983 RepID=A0A2C9W5H4_MANES|nr:uncharacterized protein LOC110610786 [Manihot esculenta]OAY53544.1 hypothetical protein MANES_03G004700v8 [Manihot esculenta]